MNSALHQKKKEAIMEKCYDCYAENGLTGTGIKALAEACGCTPGNLYSYFKNLDDLIVQSTAYCMAKVEDDFMAKAPTDPADIQRFIEEVPYWTARMHGKKYRLMYQVYTLPKYREYGKKFFEGVNERYTQYAKELVLTYTDGREAVLGKVTATANHTLVIVALCLGGAALAGNITLGCYVLARKKRVPIEF